MVSLWGSLGRHHRFRSVVGAARGPRGPPSRRSMGRESLRVAGDQLRLLREARGWSPSDLAEKACQPPEIIAQAERGEVVELHVLEAVAAVLAVPIAQWRNDVCEPL